MKIFQIQFLISILLSFSIISSSILFPNSLAQEDTQIPSWIKNVSAWWADDLISEKEFLAAIEYLINNNIISLVLMPCDVFGTSDTESVPSWVKNAAGWWANDEIDDDTFINALTYLIKEQIISIF